MRTKNSFFVLPILLVMLIFPLGDATAAEPTELTALRNEFASQIKGAGNNIAKETAFRGYIQELTSLESYLRGNMQSRSSINAVRKEIRKMNKNVQALNVGKEETAQQVKSSQSRKRNISEPAELIELRKKFNSQRKGASGETGVKAGVSEYIQELTSLEHSLRSNMRGRESVNAVRREIRSVKNASSITPVEIKAVPQPADIKPVVVAEKPIIKEVPPPASTPEPIIQKMVEAKPKPVASVSSPVKPLTIPDIVPVITPIVPVVNKPEVRAKAKVPAAVKPSAAKNSSAEVQKVVIPAPTITSVSKPVVKEVADVATPKPVVKPQVAKPARVAAIKPAVAEMIRKPEVASVASKGVSAPASNASVVKPAVVKSADKSQKKEAKELVFKPAAPKPIPKAISKKPAPEAVKKAQKKPLPAPKTSVPVKAVASKPKPVQAATVAKKPAAKPVTVTKRKTARSSGKTYVDETRGVAGSRSVRKNHVYTFNLKKPGSQSILKFYAAGQKSNDTFGKIWLVNSLDQPTNVGKWKSGDFNITADKVSSYKDLKPVTLDISKYVKESGEYKIEFDWTDFGTDPLVIFRVEITS